MKKLLLITTTIIVLSISFNNCNAQCNYEVANEIAQDTLIRNYQKHVFYVDRFSYECGNSNGEVFGTTYILHGRGTCSIPDEDPAERVNLSFITGNESRRAHYDKNRKIIYIYYPESQFNNIQGLLLNSEKIWVQFFYFGNNNEKTYGDVHGRLVDRLE